MKRWIYAASNAESNVNSANLIAELQTYINKNLRLGTNHQVELQAINSRFNDMTITDAAMSIKIRRQPTFKSGQSVSELGNIYISRIDELISNDDIVLSEDYDTFLSKYDRYFDAIYQVVTDVGEYYDSDINCSNVLTSNNYAKWQLISRILSYNEIDMSYIHYNITYALGLRVSNYGVADLPVSFQNEHIDVTVDPLLRVHGTKHVFDSISLAQFNNGLEDYKLALSDYFEAIQIGIASQNEPNDAEFKKRMRWTTLLNSLRNDLANEIDPIYEKTESGMYIEQLMLEVESKLGIIAEASTQHGSGIIDFIDAKSNDNLGGTSYENYIDDILDIVLNSKNMTQFKSSYSNYLQNLITE